MSKDLLKEAIADARAVRETAIANAKLALEEAFTPKLQSMLSAKLQEDDEMDDEELEDEIPVDATATEEMEDEMGADEAPVEDELDLGEMDHEEEETEEAHHEGTYSEEDEVPGEEEEDLELEAIIRELDGEDEEEHIAEDEHEDVPAEDEELDLDEIIRSLSEEDEVEDEPVAEYEDAEADLKEAYKVINSLKNTLQEVNLLNAKLLFSNKLFKSNNLSENQKMKVIETFDRASNLREVKLVYTTLSESFTSTSKKRVTEGFASKKSNSTAPKGRIVESNAMADRMKRLAGLL